VAIVGVAVDQAWLAVPAGCCALLAGLCTLDLADRLGRATASHDVLAARASKLEDQSDQMAARTLHLEAEVLDTRIQLAEAIRHEAARQTARTDGAGGSGSGPDPVIDQATGLFNERFFMATLEKRVSAARRGLRPLGLTLLEVVADISSGRPVPSDPVIVTEALVGTLREADTVAHLDDGRFAVLLEDTPENGAIWTIERVRRRLSQSHPGHTVWAGLSCYPAHGFDQDQLVGQASAALSAAKELRQDRIEDAVTPED
jgi:diguanylate cyclase (GGDEF)-like protein